MSVRIFLFINLTLCPSGVWRIGDRKAWHRYHSHIDRPAYLRATVETERLYFFFLLKILSFQKFIVINI